jgi:hypothetical protein
MYDLAHRRHTQPHLEFALNQFANQAQRPQTELKRQLIRAVGPHHKGQMNQLIGRKLGGRPGVALATKPAWP